MLCRLREKLRVLDFFGSDHYVASNIPKSKKEPLFSEEEKVIFWDTLTTSLKQQLSDIESLKYFDPYSFLKHYKPEFIPQFVQAKVFPPQSSGQASTSTTHRPVNPHIQIVSPTPLILIMARYDPIALPSILHDIPQNYDQRIQRYGDEGEAIAQQHLAKINDTLDLWEIDEDDVKMRFLAQSFIGEVKTWFRSLQAGSIANYDAFETTILDKWEDKKNPQKPVTQYKNLKRNQIEIIQEFSSIFLKTYQAIPPLYKPPLEAAQLHYADAFESEFSLLLRERESETLTDMMDAVVKVEINMIAPGKLKQKTDNEKKKDQPSTLGQTYVRLETMMKTMEKFSEKLSIDNKPPPRHQPNP